MDFNTGVITLDPSVSFDRETQDLYVLQVLVKDSGSSPLVTTATVSVFLEGWSFHLIIFPVTCVCAAVNLSGKQLNHLKSNIPVLNY